MHILTNIMGGVKERGFLIYWADWKTRSTENIQVSCNSCIFYKSQ